MATPLQTYFFVFVATSVAGGFLVGQQVVVRFRGKVQRGITDPLWSLPLLLIISLASWSAIRLFSSIHPEPLDSFDPELAGHPVALFGETGRTDRGRAIVLYTWHEDNVVVANLLRSHAPGQGGVRKSFPNDHANCHGWIFTGGRYIVSGRDVPLILGENGYDEVTEPQAGDLVVYRDNTGYVLHTAIVRGQLDDGTVLVESKFGIGGRFIHCVADQPYSPQFAYFRTARGSHRITLEHYGLPDWES